MTSQWQRYREPLRITILRNGTIAIFVGALLARSPGEAARWLIATLLVLWPSFGGALVGGVVPQLGAPSHFHRVWSAGCGSRWYVVRWWHRSRDRRERDCDGAACVSAGALARLVARWTRFHRHRTGGTSGATAAPPTQLL
jgi:hypothetical protein